VQEEPTVTMIFADDIEVAEAEPPPEEKALPKPPEKKTEERYIRTTQNESSAEAPEKADFVSDRNTVATAKMAPSAEGDAAMPTTEGVSFQTQELANRDFKDGDIKEDSAPSAPPMNSAPAPPPLMPEPSPPSSPAVATQPASAPVPDKPQLRSPDAVPQQQPQQESAEAESPKMEMAKKTDSSMEEMMQELDREIAANAAAQNPALEIRRALPPTAANPPATPAPAPQESMPPAPPAPPAPRAIPMPEPIANTPNPEEDAFQPHTRTSKQKGMISNRGDMDAVNAAATPTGRYMRQVTSQIEKKWHLLRKLNQDFVEPGKLRIQFYVNKDGKTEDITILSNQANAVMTDFSLTAILKAELPPIPKDLLLILEKQRVEIEYDIVIY